MRGTSQPDRTFAEPIRRLVEPRSLPIERLPILRNVFQKLAAATSTKLKPLCNLPVTIELSSLMMPQVAERAELFKRCVCAVFHSPEWDARVVISLNHQSVALLAEAIFGGDGSEAFDNGERAWSPVEVRIAREVCMSVADGLAPLLAALEPMTLRLEQLEVEPDQAMIDSGSGAVITALFNILVLSTAGQLSITVPEAALLPFRRKLEQVREVKPAVQEPNWKERILDQVEMADVRLIAVLDAFNLCMREIAALRPMQTLKLPNRADDLLSLEVLGQPLLRCRLGQSDGMFTVQLDSRIESPGDLLSEIDG